MSARSFRREDGQDVDAERGNREYACRMQPQQRSGAQRKPGESPAGRWHAGGGDIDLGGDEPGGEGQQHEGIDARILRQRDLHRCQRQQQPGEEAGLPAESPACEQEQEWTAAALGDGGGSRSANSRAGTRAIQAFSSA